MKLVGLPALREQRLLHGFSMPDVAKRVKLDRNSIRRLEYGGNATPGSALALATLYGVEIKDIFAVRGKPVSPQESCMRG